MKVSIYRTQYLLNRKVTARQGFLDATPNASYRGIQLQRAASTLVQRALLPHTPSERGEVQTGTPQPQLWAAHSPASGSTCSCGSWEYTSYCASG